MYMSSIQRRVCGVYPPFQNSSCLSRGRAWRSFTVPSQGGVHCVSA